MEDKKEQNKKISKIVKIGMAIFVVLVVAGSGFCALYFYQKFKIVSQEISKEPKEPKDEITFLTDEIKKFMNLPDEQPTLATVTDIEKAKNQPFFAKALNGDKVLIYADAKKAILYRPSEKKIIEVANVSGFSGEENGNKPEIINLPTVNSESQANDNGPAEEIGGELKDEPAKEMVAGESSPETVRVVVYNGGYTKGLAAKIGELLLSVPGVKISQKTNARGSYDKNLVVNLAGVKQSVLDEIISTVGGEISELPAGEIKPDADVLIIGGENRLEINNGEN